MIDVLQFNLDYTNEINEVNSKYIFRHSCLYAIATTFINDPTASEEIIFYCISEWQPEWNMKINNRDRHFTSDERRKQNISSEQLYRWSTPIDLIERYEFFLNNSITMDDIEKDVYYYNCSYPWFGPMCEYTFDQHEADNLSFADIVHHFYESAETTNIY